MNNSDPEAYIAAMWLMFLRAPGRDTAPGEPVDPRSAWVFQRIGSVSHRTVLR
jgi:hypothetical protein